MDFKEVVETRRSIRKYTEKEIPDEALRECVRLASFSPSWKNSQCVSYMIIKDKAIKDEIAEIALSAASAVAEKEISLEDNERLIESFIDRVGEQ